MALTSRAERNLNLSDAAGKTPGPGEYGGMKDERSSINFTGFASSCARKLGCPRYLDAPGPGSYLPVRMTESAEVSMSSFASRSKRNETLSDGPGPGAYRDPFKEYMLLTRPRKCTSLQPQIVTEPRFNPPTIPTRYQSSGYNETQDGKLIPLPQNNVIVNKRIQKKRRHNKEGFGSAQRNIWVTSKNRNAPGPGTYEIESRKSSEIHLPSSAFRSTVVRDINNERKPIEQPLEIENNTELKKSHEKLKDTSFGSKAERKGWHRDTNAPYSDPIDTPGPGSYNYKIEHLPEERAPFNSTDPRPCLTKSEDDRISKFLRGDGKAPQRKAQPGPGAYRSLFDIRILHLGKSTQEPKADDASLRPQHSPNNVSVVLEPQTILEMMMPKQAQPIVIQKQNVRPRPLPRPTMGTSPIKATLKNDELRVGADPCVTSAGVVSDFFVDPSPKKPSLGANFASRSARHFDSNSHLREEIPGPADYDPERAFRRQDHQKSGLIPQDARFRDSSSTSAKMVGPGSYSIPPTSLVKKSFNITYSTQKKLAGNKNKRPLVGHELSQITCTIPSMDGDLLLTKNSR